MTPTNPWPGRGWGSSTSERPPTSAAPAALGTGTGAAPQNPDRPDVCIGTDQFHTPAWLRDFAVRTFEELGYRVAVDRPFAGAIVPMRFYQTDRRVRAVMVEVNRGLYMDERSGAKRPGFDEVRERIAGSVRTIAGLASSRPEGG